MTCSWRGQSELFCGWWSWYDHTVWLLQVVAACQLRYVSRMHPCNCWCRQFGAMFLLVVQFETSDTAEDPVTQEPLSAAESLKQAVVSVGHSHADLQTMRH